MSYRTEQERPHSRRFEGKVVVVTGAARSIGLAIANRLASEGASLVLADVMQDELESAGRQVEKTHGGKVLTVHGDLSTELGAADLHRRSVEQFGIVSVLVNNAGGGVILPFLSHTPETLHATINRNLWTTIWCSRVFLPEMVSQNYGRIVNLGADSVRNGLFEHAAYNAAKGGVHGLTTGLAREFARSGITVNTVAPCAVNSNDLQKFIKEKPDLAERFLSVIPLGRAAELDEVASAVAYLASNEASFITGQVISVNGGSTML